MLLDGFRAAPDLDVWVVPNMAEHLGFSPESLLDELGNKYPSCGEEGDIPFAKPVWVLGDNRALKYRGHVLKREKMWLQDGDPLNGGFPLRPQSAAAAIKKPRDTPLLLSSALNSIAKLFGEKRLEILEVDDFEELVARAKSFLVFDAASLVAKFQSGKKSFSDKMRAALHKLFDVVLSPLIKKADEVKGTVENNVFQMGDFKKVDAVADVLAKVAAVDGKENPYFKKVDAVVAVKQAIQVRIARLEKMDKETREVFQRRAVYKLSAEKRELWNKCLESTKGIYSLTGDTGDDALRVIENRIEELQVKVERVQWFAATEKEKYLNKKESEVVVQKKHTYIKDFVLNEQFVSIYPAKRAYTTSFASKNEFVERYGAKATAFWQKGIEERVIEVFDLFEELDSEVDKYEKQLKTERRRLASRTKELLNFRSTRRGSFLQMACGDESIWMDDALKALSAKTADAKERLIWWIFSHAGCTGKSKVFGQRLVREKGAFIMPGVTVNPRTGTPVLQQGMSLFTFYADAIAAAADNGTLDPENPILIVDLPRFNGGVSVDEVLLASGFYTACEQLKGGSFFNSRFKGKLSGLGRAPFIIVTANGPPPLGDSVLARCGAMSFDRIEALQISVDQTKVGAHIPTKERLLEIAKTSQQDDDSQADFGKKGFDFDPEKLHAAKRARLSGGGSSGSSSGLSSGSSSGQKIDDWHIFEQLYVIDERNTSPVPLKSIREEIMKAGGTLAKNKIKFAKAFEDEYADKIAFTRSGSNKVVKGVALR